MKITFPGPTYDVIEYPGGEIETRFKKEFWSQLHDSPKVTIDARIHSVKDAFALLCLSDSLHALRDGCDITLRMPYLPFARNDRRFVDGGSYGLRIFGEMIRLGSFNKYITLDVHNDTKALRHISSFLLNIEATDLINRAFADFSGRYGSTVILFPDAGAKKRYAVHFPYPSAAATKERDPETGKLKGFTVPNLEGWDNCLIVDDLCDAGGTFLGIAKKLRDQCYTGTLGLYVTHGIFSAGFTELTLAFSRIYTTNSVLGWPAGDSDMPVVVYDAWEALDGR